jgi:hypothetical protein
MEEPNWDSLTEYSDIKERFPFIETPHHNNSNNNNLNEVVNHDAPEAPSNDLQKESDIS